MLVVMSITNKLDFFKMQMTSFQMTSVIGLQQMLDVCLASTAKSLAMKFNGKSDIVLVWANLLMLILAQCYLTIN